MLKTGLQLVSLPSVALASSQVERAAVQPEVGEEEGEDVEDVEGEDKREEEGVPGRQAGRQVR